MKRHILLVTAAALAALGTHMAFAQSLWNLKYPGSDTTDFYGIDGNVVVGSYSVSNQFPHGFEYNFSTNIWSPLPDVPTASGTFPRGISNDTIVGYYGYFVTDPGFVYDTSGYHQVDYSTAGDGPLDTFIYGISGSQYVGQGAYQGGTGQQGFVHDGSGFHNLDYPGAVANTTVPLGIDGNNIVGTYQDTSTHGFLYNRINGSWQTIDDPAAPGNIHVNGISGNKIVGYTGGSGSSFGFVYDVSSGSFTSLINPADVNDSIINGISGNYVIGDSDGAGFIIDLNHLSGDFNRDGHVNAADIIAMEAALTNLHSYQSTNGLTDSQLLTIGDINGDGVVTNADVQALINLLKTGGGSNNPVPEPSTFVLAVLAALMVGGLRLRF